VQIFPDPDANKIYAPGYGTDDIYIHPWEPFTGSPTVVDGTAAIGASSGNGCLSVGGAYLWLSGNGNNLPFTDTPIRVMDTTTNVVTDMGYATSAYEYVIAATDSPLRVWIADSSDIRCFAPNIATGSLGAALWTNTTIPTDFVQIDGPPAQWDSGGNLWFTQGTNIFQVSSTTGSYAVHAQPAATVGLNHVCQPAFDSANNKMFCVFGFTGGINTVAYLYSYSGWSTSLVADSGTWELIDSYPIPGARYGRWICYDPVTDVIFMLYREDPIGGIHYAYRYTGNPKTLVDTVYISDITGTADVYPYAPQGPSGYYQDNIAYFVAKQNNQLYIIKMIYGGSEVLVDAEGNSLLEGGNVGRLHNLADSYINYEGTATDTVTGLEHLEGEDVVVWAQGVDLGTDDDYEQTYTVVDGEIELPAAYTNITVGLPYTARWESSKLALQTQMEVLFGRSRRITEMAIVLADTHAKGIRFGPDEDNLDDRPLRDDWKDVDPDNIDTAYDADMIQFPATWDTDPRLYLQAQAPRPCTVLAVKLNVEV
jgi:hypothetical protein